MKEQERDMTFEGKAGNSQVLHVLARPVEDFVFLFKSKRGKEDVT